MEKRVPRSPYILNPIPSDPELVSILKDRQKRASSSDPSTGASSSGPSPDESSCSSSCKILTVDVYKTEPWKLPTEAALTLPRDEAFVFTYRKISWSGSADRKAGRGKWKHKYKREIRSTDNRLVGHKVTLSYKPMRGGSDHPDKDKYLMDEYTVAEDDGGCAFQYLVLCRIRRSPYFMQSGGGVGGEPGEDVGAENADLQKRDAEAEQSGMESIEGNQLHDDGSEPIDWYNFMWFDEVQPTLED